MLAVMRGPANKRLVKLATALWVVAVLGAAQASSAFAAAVTGDVQWFTGALPGVALVGPETVGAAQVGAAKLKTATYEFTWTGTECVECTINNVGGKAVGAGKLKFNGVAVVKPAGCAGPAAITTKALTLEPDWMIEKTNYWKITPAAGPATAFATIEITGCPQEGIVIPKGTAFFQTANATEVQALEQSATSSEAINTAASGAAGALHIGAEAAELGLTAKFKMTGAKAGEVFGTH